MTPFSTEYRSAKQKAKAVQAQKHRLFQVYQRRRLQTIFIPTFRPHTPWNFSSSHWISLAKALGSIDPVERTRAIRPLRPVGGGCQGAVIFGSSVTLFELSAMGIAGRPFTVACIKFSKFGGAANRHGAPWQGAGKPELCLQGAGKGRAHQGGLEFIFSSGNRWRSIVDRPSSGAPIWA